MHAFFSNLDLSFITDYHTRHKCVVMKNQIKDNRSLHEFKDEVMNT